MEDENLKKDEILVESIKWGVPFGILIIALFLICFWIAPEELKDTVIGVFLIIAACMMFGPIFYGVIKKIWSYQKIKNRR